jgi:hypothetical protein
MVLMTALPGQSALPFEPNAARLQTGSFLYRTVVGGEEAGRSKIQIRQNPRNRYTFSNSVGGLHAQSWEAIANPDMSPVSAKLVFGEGEGAKAAFELHYDAGRAKGFSKLRPVDDSIVAGTVDQRIDWAAVMSIAEYREGAEYTFHVYDPGTGNSLVQVRVGATETIEVPAGRFEAVRVVYRIEKSRGTEEYRVFVRKATPRFLVKEAFPDGSVIELTGMEP